MPRWRIALTDPSRAGLRLGATCRMVTSTARAPSRPRRWTCSTSSTMHLFTVQEAGRDGVHSHSFWLDLVCVCVCVCRTLDVNQVDGGVYFGFHNEICFKPNNASSASCWVWPTSLVPAEEEFKYIYINQRTTPQLAHAHASQHCYGQNFTAPFVLQIRKSCTRCRASPCGSTISK